MSKNLSANIIKKIKKGYNKKLVKDIKIFLRKKKKTCNIMVMNFRKTFQKMKNKSWSSIEKKYRIRKNNFL